MSNSQTEILSRAIKKLKMSNTRVSIRGLASAMDISHVFLGKLIRGQARVPLKLLPSLAKILKLDEFDKQSLKNMILEHRFGTSAITTPSEANENFQEYIDLPEGHFKYFANWWSFAALDLMTCNLPLKLNRITVGSLLDIPAEELGRFLDFMISIGIVEETNEGLKKTQKKLRIPTGAPSIHTKSLYRQVSQLTYKELSRSSEKDFEKRLILGYCCATNPTQVAKAKDIMAKAVKKCAEVLAEGDCTDVYWIQGQMFSLLGAKDD